MSKRLIIQLARLGDFLQSLPTIASLKANIPDDQFDLLCAAPLVPLGAFFPAVGQVFPWDGDEWGQIAKSWSHKRENALAKASDCLRRCQAGSYSLAYNLNNHPRAMLASHLYASEVMGSGCYGPLSSRVPNWVKYLQILGTHRGGNRVHLADAFCGICGVRPPTSIPMLTRVDREPPMGLSSFFSDNDIRVALVIGSGDADRRIPLQMWDEWIRTFLTACPEGRIMLVGGAGERQLTNALLDRIPSLYLGRVWNACGQTSLPHLANILSQCDWVIGSDTGPLHLGVACGAKVQGFYFSRARVHETGPYGHGHWVWQADQQVKNEKLKMENSGYDTTQQTSEGSLRPELWPVQESVELLLTETCVAIPERWSLWKSQHDEWGAHFVQYPDSNRESGGYRTQIWKILNGRNVDWDSVHELMGLSVSAHVS
ncbi:glycosyltransferase family 9 protein [Nitrospira sp. M1]